MRERELIQEQIDKRVHGQGMSMGISEREISLIQTELLLDIRDILTK